MPRIPQSLKKLEQSLPALIKSRRQELGLTLQEVADRTDLSAAFISQSERGKTTPSLISLIQIAEALETDIHYFISPPKADTLIKRAESPVALKIDSPVDYFSLESAIRNQKMSCLMMKVPAGYSAPTQIHRDGEDFIYVLDGEIEVVIEEESFILKKGDSSHFNSQVNHSINNPGKKQSTILWVSTPSLFEGKK